MSNGIQNSMFSNAVGWGPEDTEKAKAMIKRERRDGSKRFTLQEVANYTGMPLARIEAISRNMVVGDTLRYTASRLQEEDASLFHEAIRFKESAVQGSRALAERIRAVYG